MDKAESDIKHIVSLVSSELHDRVYSRKDTDDTEDLARVSNILTSIVASILYGNGFFRYNLKEDPDSALLLIDELCKFAKGALSDLVVKDKLIH